MSLYLVLAVGLIAISFASILIKLCDAPAMVIASYRLGVSALFFAAVSGVKKGNPFTKFSGQPIFLALVSGFFLSLHFATWITSLKYTSVANSVVLVSTSPVFVAVGSVFFLKEKITRLQIFGIVLTLLGAGILSLNELALAHRSIVGNALALVGAVGAAGYFLVGRNLRSQFDTRTYVTAVYSTAAVLLLIVTLSMQLPLTGYDRKIYGLFVLIAVLPQIIGHTSFNWALKFVSATMISIITLGEPVGAVILAYFLLQEKITANQAIGGILILSGVALAIRGESLQKTKPIRESAWK